MKLITAIIIKCLRACVSVCVCTLQVTALCNQCGNAKAYYGLNSYTHKHTRCVSRISKPIIVGNFQIYASSAHTYHSDFIFMLTTFWIFCHPHIHSSFTWRDSWYIYNIHRSFCSVTSNTYSLAYDQINLVFVFIKRDNFTRFYSTLNKLWVCTAHTYIHFIFHLRL